MRVALCTAALLASSAVHAWNMNPVRSIQARAQGDTPEWDATNKAYVSAYGKTFEDKYTAVLDTVNLASVEGVLKYIQSECINAPDLQKCERKNKVKNIVFYDIWIAQPNASIAQFGTKTDVYPEYGQFVAMDSGACTPTSGSTLPPECLQYNGKNGTANLGPFVGGVASTTDARAAYPNTIWFSYPNSCVQSKWADKSAQCRALFTGGLCPFGVKPDGIKCTFSYTILGYVSLDDIVGITAMKNPATSANFANYSEFCNAKLTEFSATLLPSNSWGDVKSDLKFWDEPNDVAANQKRAEAVVTTYGKKVSKPMVALPTIEELTKSNPPCFENSKLCYDAPFGCRRTLYAQVCQVCNATAADCIVKNASYVFPTLTLPTLPPTTVPASKGPNSSGSAAGNNNAGQGGASAASSVHIGLAAAAAALVAFAH